MNFLTLTLNHKKTERFKNFFRQFENLFFFSILQKEIWNSKTVLDVGCGNDSPVGRINRTFRSEGIDIYPKCIKVSKERKLHTKYKLGDVKRLEKYYQPKSFDTVVCMDVVEHLTKKQSLKMIREMEQIARKKVIIMTPRGYIDQHDYDGNPYQEHHSGWETKDFEDLGYKVYGLRGLKWLRNNEATIRFKPWIFWGALSAISEILFYPFPKLSFQLFAVKNISNQS